MLNQDCSQLSSLCNSASLIFVIVIRWLEITKSGLCNLLGVEATFYPNYDQWSYLSELSRLLLNWNTYNLSKSNSLQTFLLLSFENAAARAAVIGSHHQILDADWMLYCALALLAGHSKTNVSHSDTPGKSTLWGQLSHNHNKVSSLGPGQLWPSLPSSVLRNQEQNCQIYPRFVRTWVSIYCSWREAISPSLYHVN